MYVREIGIYVDRLYYLEVANSAIDDEQRRKRLFTVLGKRCFGRNDNKLDSYLRDTEYTPNEIYEYFFNKQEEDRPTPTIYKLVTYNTNQYTAYNFIYRGDHFVFMKQVNISARKTFEKIFLIQITEDEHKALLQPTVSSIKIEFIFNIMGKIFLNLKD